MIFGKVYNARWSVERTRRDHAPRVDGQRFSAVSQQLQGLLPQIAAETSPDSLRGLEGIGAAAYFSVLDEMILQGKETFFFRERSRRPPLDTFNAMLSFAYSLLSHDCASALESVGLDAYVGYLHTDRPGRESLALDLMEELRPCFADRFVLTLINNRIIKPSNFEFRESGAVLLAEEGRRIFLQKWLERKRETITHPFLEEKLPWGLVPYVQSLLLARYLRGGWVVLSFRRLKSRSYFLAQGLNRPMLASVISILDSAEPSRLSFRKLCWPWGSLALPFFRASRYFFRAACSTWPVSLPVLIANAMVF